MWHNSTSVDIESFIEFWDSFKEDISKFHLIMLAKGNIVWGPVTPTYQTWDCPFSRDRPARSVRVCEEKCFSWITIFRLCYRSHLARPSASPGSGSTSISAYWSSDDVQTECWCLGDQHSYQGQPGECRSCGL